MGPPDTDTLNKLVSGLPEIYQPIFGHPELSGPASRPSLDRLTHIRKVYDLLSRRLARPLRVLDIGCAQGFFSLHLAEAGAEVVGIDALDANIRLCEVLGAAPLTGTTLFRLAKVEDYILEINPGQFDLFLGLSVFHHLCHAHGFDKTRSIVSILAENIPVGLFELALADEPLYWANSLPKDELSLLDAFPFVHVLDRFPTHLSKVSRPLAIASTEYWILGNSCGQFESATTLSHQGAVGGDEKCRVYYRGEDLFVKKHPLVGRHAELNRLELTNEIQFLITPAPGFFPIPKLHSWCLEGDTGWLVRDELRGRLLSDILTEHGAYDSHRTIREVLTQLVALEAAGQYHNDLRVWNTLILHDGSTTLIDYGAISSVPKDCLSHQHPIFSFFVYVEEVTTRAMRPDPLLRFSYADPSNLPDGVAGWLNRIWEHPIGQWSYRLFLQLFSDWERGKPSQLQPALVESTRLENLKRYIALYEARLTELSHALMSAESDRIARGKMIEEQSRALAQADEQIGRATSAYSDLQRSHAEKVAALSAADDKLLLLTRKLSDATSAYTDLQRSLDQKSSEQRDASLAYADLERSYSEKLAALTAADEKLRLLTQQLNDATSAYSDLQRSLDQKTSEQRDASVAYAALERSHSENVTALRNAAVAYAQMEQALAEKTAALADASAAYTDLKSSHDEKIDALAKAEENAQNFALQLSKSEQDRNDLWSQLNETYKALENIKSQLQLTDAHIGELVQKNTGLEDQLSFEKRELIRVEQSYQERTSVLSSETAELRQQLAATINSHASKISAMNSQIEDLKSRITAADKRLEMIARSWLGWFVRQSVPAAFPVSEKQR